MTDVGRGTVHVLDPIVIAHTALIGKRGVIVAVADHVGAAIKQCADLDVVRDAIQHEKGGKLGVGALFGARQKASECSSPFTARRLGGFGHGTSHGAKCLCKTRDLRAFAAAVNALKHDQFSTAHGKTPLFTHSYFIVAPSPFFVKAKVFTKRDRKKYKNML